MIGSTRTGKLMIGGILVSFVILRASLYLSPAADFYVAGYNIHHLFSGILIAILCLLPLVIVRPKGRKGAALAFFSGIGLGMMLDEWVYLIVTDGSNASYLLPVSFWGGLAMVLVCVAYILLLVRLAHLRTPK
ncbi:MAG: hypothetical protein O6931_04275 [Gammaproteobacteria bacterium]|nr:hypothetical protein [Gammaproteobacteria bacterium]